MNILIPDSWLRKHLKMKATPKEIAENLSLCSQSVEKTIKTEDDFIYEIEITTNRPDCLSVYGIARELAAILPRFGIPAKLQPLSHITYHISHITNSLPLEVKITNPSFCPRFTALIFDNIKMGSSPRVIQERLEKSGIRALDNVVDISNYLMLELGQPMHTFDYDKIKGAKMILRESKEREKVITLDGQTRDLPKGTVIIEDGEGRIIDLCGIMGAENSAVDANTKRVLLFIQTYDPAQIRRTCQLMGFRTEAASRFEKGIDPEGVMIAMKRAVIMFEKNCEAQIASNLIDLYPNPPKQKIITLDLGLVEKIMGIKISKNEITNILKSLGFSILNFKFSILSCSVPHWRNGDISIPEDLIEEIARIYGYHNLPTSLPSGQIPQKTADEIFTWAQKTKNALKFWGFTETYNYSFVSEQSLKNAKISTANLIKVANPLNEEWVYMRPTLIPSLLEVVAKNQDQFEKIQIFELANIYLPKRENQLPEENQMLCAAMTKTDFYQVKGIIEGLFSELGIDSFQLKPLKESDIFYSPHSTQIFVGKSLIGTMGEINPQNVFLFDLNFAQLVKYATKIKRYTSLPKYPAIIEDMSFVVPEKTQVGDIIQSIESVSFPTKSRGSSTQGVGTIIKSVSLLDAYQNTRTFRITYQHPTKTLTGKEVEKIREKIITELEKQFRIHLKA